MFIIFPRISRERLMRTKAWFKETFRHHSLDEYREFFTRGMGSDDGENRVYPWIYMRLFFLCFVIFGLTAFIIRLTGNGISVPTLMLMGAVLITAPFTVLLFELNPKKDLSFLKVIAVLIIGSFVADLIVYLFYFAYVPEEGYFSVLWTAFVEEFGKALPAILAILILKKRGSPMACFILAAAVGAGVSITEDLGYIFFGSGALGIDLTEILSTSILRAATSVCTHIVWSGFIGWAFGKFKRPLIDFRFWGMCIFSMALHFGWDLPSAAPIGWLFLSILVCFVLALAVMCVIIKRERIKVLGAPLLDIAPVIPEFMPVAPDYGVSSAGETVGAADDGLVETAAVAAERDFGFDNPVSEPFAPPAGVNNVNGVKAACFHAANIALAVMLSVFAVLGVALCYLQIGEYYKQETFSRAADFVEYVQDGYTFEYQKARKYDESMAIVNYYEEKLDGKLLQATQRVADKNNPDVFYYYNYRFTNDEDGTTTVALVSVDAGIGTKIYSRRTIPSYNYYDELPSYYFGEIYVINPKVADFWYDEEMREYVVNLNETEFCGTSSIIALSVIAGLALISCGTACIVNYVKAGKRND